MGMGMGMGWEERLSKTYNFLDAVYGPAVQPLALVGRVLHLQPCLDVLDRRGDGAHGPAGHHARYAVAEIRQLAGVSLQVRFRRAQRQGKERPHVPFRKDVLVQQPPVDGQGAQHEGVHEHPADQWWRRALVQAPYPFISHGLQHAVDGAGEAAPLRGLEAHFDRVESGNVLVPARAREHR